MIQGISLRYGNYPVRLLNTSIIQIKVKPVSKVRAIDKGPVSLQVKVSDEVMDGYNKRDFQEVSVASKMMVGQMDTIPKPIEFPYKVPIIPDTIYRSC